jgi:hypothetical protein
VERGLGAHAGYLTERLFDRLPAAGAGHAGDGLLLNRRLRHHNTCCDSWGRRNLNTVVNYGVKMPEQYTIGTLAKEAGVNVR